MMGLSDYFIPLCAVVKGFDRQTDRGPETLAEQIDSLVHQAQTRALNEGTPVEQFQQALFPVLAWADEHISRHHQWDADHAWQKHLLQRRYFKTALAGREFFDRLDGLTDNDTELREVYVLCLCLGFMGKYSTTPNSGELAGIRLAQYNRLQHRHSASGSTDNDLLFPDAYGTAADGPTAHKSVARRRLSLQRILLFILPPLILILVAAGLHAQLTAAVQHFRDAVNL
ncbi:MAG: DotU family type IV/VI secretion system protein [Pusillimonas sp.]